MKIGFVSDTLGNYPAFHSVMKHMGEQEVDKKVHLGNLVGYCASPNECVELTISEFNYILVGRFDEAVVDRDTIISMAPLEANSAEWTYDNISEEIRSVISNIENAYISDNGMLFINGTPRNSFGNIRTEEEALKAFASSPFNMAFVGQTGIPDIWEIDSKSNVSYQRAKFNNGGVAELSIKIKAKSRYIVNVGSVGLPKDGDARASYAIYDTDKKILTHFRVPYSIDKTVGKMQQKSFPSKSWMKILYGK